MWPNLSSAVLDVLREVTVGYVDADIRDSAVRRLRCPLPTRHVGAPRMRNRPELHAGWVQSGVDGFVQ